MGPESVCLDSHRAILTEGIAPVTDDADAVAGKLVDRLRVELQAVTREQVDAVFDRADAKQWAQEILDYGTTAV